MLTPADMPPGYRLVLATEADLIIVDDDMPQFLINASVSADGILEFEIETEINGTRGTLRGSVLYELMMQQLGSKVKKIRGLWVSGSNLNEVNRLTKLGLLLEKAVFLTWSGKRAYRLGYTEIDSIEFRGRPGMYGNVDVVFARSIAGGPT